VTTQTLPPPSPHNPAVFDLCPLFLLLVIVSMLIAEVDAAAVGLPPPHGNFSGFGLLLEFLVFAVPFAVTSKPRTARDWLYVVTAALILPLGNEIMPWATTQTIEALPHVYDSQVASLDAALGVQPSFMIGEIFVRHPIVTSICEYCYAAVVFPAALVAAMEARIGRRMGLGALPTFLVIAGVGFPIYHLLPVVGPAPHFGSAFPFPTASAHLPAPRNCMPSLHTAWVLMAFLTTRDMPWQIRAVTAFAAAGTMITTLGAGEHYLTDLVVACPFVLLIRALCATELPIAARERWGSCLIGLALIIAWGLAVRGIVAPASTLGLVPSAMLATVIISLCLERNLTRAAEARLESAAIPSNGPAFA
jgi:hypothetical protein